MIVILVVVLFLSVGRVNVGYVAVIVDPVRGTVSSAGDGATASYFFKPPWVSVIQVYVGTETVHMWTEDDQTGDWPAIPSLTKEGVEVEVDLTVQWSLSPDKIVRLFHVYPRLDWKDRAIIPIIHEAVNDTIVQFTATETVEKIDTISVQLETILKTKLETEPSLSNATILGTIDLSEITLASS